MNNPEKPTATTAVACEICLREVPLSETHSEETNDYVMYFCGLECYQKWRAAGTDEQ